MNRANLLVALLCLFPAIGWALSSDQNQPVRIEADHLEIDDSKRISEYSGNVRMVQGSLNINADRIEFHLDENQNLLWLRIEGRPARFDQLNDNNEPVNASALVMDYYESEGRLEMRGEARVKTGEDLIESKRIRLNTANDTVEAGDPDGNSRVRMVIQPQNRTSGNE